MMVKQYLYGLTTTSFLGVLILLTPSCIENRPEKVNFEPHEIEEVTPAEITRFDHADSVYFSHLGYSSVVLKNSNNILIPDRDFPALVVADKNGKLEKHIREGKGPGEIQDIYNFTLDTEGKIYSYDQRNNKVMTFNSEMELVTEKVPPAYKASSIVRVYPMASEKFIYELTSFAFLEQENKDREKIFVQYAPLNESYGEELRLKDQPYYRVYKDDRVVGGGAVPYADIQLVDYYPKNKSLLIFDTRTNIIAEIDANYDTLQIIQVNLPKEKLSSEERDSLEADGRTEQWSSLEPLLPEYKASADKMIFYDDKIWLKSNLRGDSQKWQVLNMKGEIEKIVKLPKESMLMHVSDQHLGVRLDDATFALYEPVN